MLRPRIIPCLLLHEKGLVKTTRFTAPKYVGDPINAVRIFNEKQVDELIFLDIDATRLGREPDYQLIANVAAECRMPLCYGGGVKTVEQAVRIIKLGVEKVAVSSAALSNPLLLKQMAKYVGSQSIVGVLDVKANLEVWSHNATLSSGRRLPDVARHLEDMGVGEIVVNSIDDDGLMSGYNFDSIRAIRNLVNVPITALGGAGNLSHIKALIDEFGIIGAAAGSLFVFKGPYKAVLINYPNRSQKASLINSTLSTHLR